MLNPFRKVSTQSLCRKIRSFVFFALFYLYLWLDIDLRLIYHGGGTIEDFPVFYTGWTFFREFLSYPGGPVEYAAAFLSQFFYYSWAGALTVTLQAWLISVCTDYIFKTLNSPRLRFLRFLPPILLLVLYTQYTFHFVTSTAMLAALAFACLYLKLTPKSMPVKLAAFMALSVMLYTITGAAYLLFAFLCGIYELLFRARLRITLFYLISAAALPYLMGVLIFDVSIIDAYSNLLPFSWKTLLFDIRKYLVITVYILYLQLPLFILSLGLWRIAACGPAGRKIRPPSIDHTQKPLIFFSRITNSRTLQNLTKTLQKPEPAAWLSKTLLLLVISGAAVFAVHDNRQKAVLAVDYYASRNMWTQVLAIAERHPDNFFVVHAANRALYHTGRLGYDMLSSHQNPNLLLLTFKNAYENWKKFDTLIDLGFINEAQHDLTESLEKYGERPLILKRLALINMVKGNIPSARIYLGALSKTLFHADWAKNYLCRLNSDPNLTADGPIQQLRSVMMEKDYGALFFDAEYMLLALLEKNRHNQMAFEYLMSCYMLTAHLDRFMQNIGRLKDFDYSRVPRLYEEAMLTYMYRTKKVVDLQTHRVGPETLKNFRGFMGIFDGYGGNRDAAYNEIVKDYGDSFFFYYIYGRSGIKK